VRTASLLTSGLCLSFFLVTVAACSSRPRPEVETFSKNQRVELSDFPDAHAVILLDRTEVTFFAPKGKDKPIAEILHLRRIQIATEKGKELARALLPFDDRTRYVSVQGKIIKPDGSSKEMHADATVDVDRFKDGMPAARLYDGKGYKAVKVGSPEIGDVVELTTLALVRDPRWLEPVPVGGDLPFVRGEVIVHVPKGFEVDTRVTKQGRVVQGIRPNKIPTRIGSLTERTSEDDGMSGTKLVFIFEREPALFPEGAAPDASALATQVHVQLLRFQPDRGAEGRGFQSFDDVAQWYRELTKGMDQPDDKTKELARGMNKGAKLDKIRSVQRYVQDDVKDVPTFLHLAALPSHKAGDVIRAGIGDSKDQASLTLALLRQLGIDGFPVLVSRAGSFASVPDLPTPAPFNHVVIAIPQGGSYAFVDPSTPGLPTGRLPGKLQGQKGVLVRADRGELLDLPEDKPEDNLTTVELDLVQEPTGVVSGLLKATLRGVDAALARQALEDPDTAAPILQALLLGDDAGAPDLLTKIELTDPLRVASKDNDAEAPLKLQMRAKPLKPKDDVRPLDITPEVFVGRPLAFLWREGRKAPVVLNHRGITQVKLSVKMPEGKGVTELPASLKKTGSILVVEEQWAVADGAFWLSRSLRVEERIVPPERYDELRAAAQALWSRQQQTVKIVDGGDRGASYGGDPF
jgi:Domain of Unknown Function with PDB structure (DUF3857)